MFRPLTAFGILSMLCMMVAGGLFMKIGASGDPAKRWFFALIGTQSLIGIGCYGIAFALYAWLLKELPLNVIVSLAAVQFIALSIMSAMFLSEQIPPLRWIGIALIAAGVLIVAITSNRAGAV